MEETFPSHYECKELASIPERPGYRRYYYPGASQEGGRDGAIVEVNPGQGRPWLGVFAFGRITSKGVSGIFTTPNPDRFCVVARGAGYLVRADDPSAWEPVAANPIIDIRPVRARNLLIFAEYTRLFAYGPAGLAWRTKHLTWDDLIITEVTDDFIAGEFWDVVTEAIRTFCVDLASGEHTGGVPTL
jgi:hypothetical protein